uniref:C-type lectin domain-containing protein n=1 Tax=Cyprinus carpio TaxID=7962 RepID=A0A8C1J0Y5_CYPCA
MYSPPPLLMICLILAFHISVESAEYIRVQKWKNWTDAQSYCRQHHTDLATIHNSEEWNLIKSVIPSNSWVWFGLFLDSWEWSDKWSRFFRHWAAGQPSQSSGSGDCVGMSTADSGKWAEYSCDLHNFQCPSKVK